MLQTQQGSYCVLPAEFTLFNMLSLMMIVFAAHILDIVWDGKV